jgi:hypothetical protein
MPPRRLIFPALLGLSLAGLFACVPAAEDSADTAPPVEVWLTVELLPEAPTTGDALQVSVSHDDSVSSVGYAWYRDNLLVAELDSALVSADNTARDQVWRVVVTPDRPLVTDQPVSATVTIGNSAPTVLTVDLGDAADVTTDIVASVETQDADGDSVDLAWAWSLDGAALEGAWGGSLPAGIALRGQVVGVEVTPSDGTDSGEPLAADITVGNSAPSVAVASIGLTSAAVGDTLEVLTEGWFDADGDSEDYRYAWFVDELEQSGDSASFTLDGVVAGAVCWCVVTPWDGLDEGEPVMTELVTVVEAAP